MNTRFSVTNVRGHRRALTRFGVVFVVLVSALVFSLAAVTLPPLAGGQRTVNAAASSSTRVAGKLYWTDYALGKIQRANLDGTDVEDLITGLSHPFGIALDVAGGKMYYTLDGNDEWDGKIQRANLDGTGPVENILIGLRTPTGIALDLANREMYYIVRGNFESNGKIQRANLDGAGVTDLVTGLGDPRFVTLDLTAGKMYWTDARTDSIQRANLDGTGVENLVTGLTGPWEIALDSPNGKMYWTENSLYKIQRANLDGADVKDLITGLGAPTGMKLDLVSGKMYWANQTSGKIQRANLDGTDVEDWMTGLSMPFGIALDVSVVVDTAPPVVNVSFPGSSGQNGWFVTSPVVGSVTADEMTTGGSNITALSCTGATVVPITDLGTPSASAPLTVSAEGINNVSCTATDSAGNTGAGPGSNNTATVSIDQTAPTLNPVVSPNPVLLGGAATVTSGAADVLSGLATQSCGSVDTSSVGSNKSVTCTATDRAGNSNSASVPYAVLYNFTGFFPPVDNLPVVNVAKAGSAIPVKFSLGSNLGLAILAAGYPVSQKISCDMSAPADDIELTITAGSSSLTYDAASGQYIYVWKTDKAWAGTCRQLSVRFMDGTDHKANFQFK